MLLCALTIDLFANQAVERAVSDPRNQKKSSAGIFFSRKQSQLPSMAFYFLNYCVFVFCLKQIINREDPFESNRCLKTLSSDKSNLYTKYFGAVYSATVS